MVARVGVPVSNLWLFNDMPVGQGRKGGVLQRPAYPAWQAINVLLVTRGLGQRMALVDEGLDLRC
jgi:hypothetical protein